MNRMNPIPITVAINHSPVLEMLTGKPCQGQDCSCTHVFSEENGSINESDDGGISNLAFAPTESIHTVNEVNPIHVQGQNLNLKRLTNICISYTKK